jgi:hypothetical protein
LGEGLALGAEAVDGELDGVAGAGYGCSDPQTVRVQFGQTSRRDGRPGPVDTVRGEKGAVDVGGCGGQIKQPALPRANGGLLIAGRADL